MTMHSSAAVLGTLGYVQDEQDPSAKLIWSPAMHVCLRITHSSAAALGFFGNEQDEQLPSAKLI
jgi:hypothetical protein